MESSEPSLCGSKSFLSMDMVSAIEWGLFCYQQLGTFLLSLEENLLGDDPLWSCPLIQIQYLSAAPLLTTTTYYNDQPPAPKGGQLPLREDSTVTDVGMVLFFFFNLSCR